MPPRYKVVEGRRTVWVSLALALSGEDGPS